MSFTGFSSTDMTKLRETLLSFQRAVEEKARSERDAELSDANRLKVKQSSTAFDVGGHNLTL